MFITGECDEKYFPFGGRFGFSGKAEPILEGLTTKFHHLPLEKLCTKFGAFVRPINIMLKKDANLGTNKYPFGYGQKTLNMTHFDIFYFVLMLLILLSNDISLIQIRIKLYH